MPCDRFRAEDGTVVVVCTRGPARRARACVVCQAPGTRLCDFALVGARKGDTCSRPLCDRCTAKWPRPAPIVPIDAALVHESELDLCPAHHRLVTAKGGT